MRHNENQEQQQKQKPYEGKKRRTDLDTSDLLIENALHFTQSAAGSKGESAVRLEVV
jgi:hypothetical protein